MARGLFITGTDTGVGKTYVAALIAKQLKDQGVNVGVYKPVASGCSRNATGEIIADDAVALWRGAGEPNGSAGLDLVTPQKFLAPLAPHLAARAEGQAVDSEQLRSGLAYWRDNYEFVLVEGAGGLMSPISDDDYNADLAAEFGYPLVVVAPNVLGVINQTLQTLITAAAYGDGLPVAGIVLNEVSPIDIQRDPSIESNREEIAARAHAPLLCGVSHQGFSDRPVDWAAFATVKD